MPTDRGKQRKPLVTTTSFGDDGSVIIMREDAPRAAITVFADEIESLVAFLLDARRD
jgi:hypothetical protein